MNQSQHGTGTGSKLAETDPNIDQHADRRDQGGQHGIRLHFTADRGADGLGFNFPLICAEFLCQLCPDCITLLLCQSRRTDGNLLHALVIRGRHLARNACSCLYHIQYLSLEIVRDLCPLVNGNRCGSTPHKIQCVVQHGTLRSHNIHNDSHHADHNDSTGEDHIFFPVPNKIYSRSLFLKAVELRVRQSESGKGFH